MIVEQDALFYVHQACQCTELDCLIPLQYGVTKLVLVGDPEQLPPTVISQVGKLVGFFMLLICTKVYHQQAQQSFLLCIPISISNSLTKYWMKRLCMYE